MFMDLDKIELIYHLDIKTLPSQTKYFHLSLQYLRDFSLNFSKVNKKCSRFEEICVFDQLLYDLYTLYDLRTRL